MTFWKFALRAFVYAFAFVIILIGFFAGTIWYEGHAAIAVCRMAAVYLVGALILYYPLKRLGVFEV